jgi:hypothetical protein
MISPFENAPIADLGASNCSFFYFAISSVAAGDNSMPFE